MVFLFVGIVFIYLISNLFVLQPAGEPDPDDSNEPTYSVTKENAYLKAEPDGEYAIYIDGTFVSELDKDELRKEPFSSLSIKQ